ncbi:Veg family protein [Limosilactobacillus sp.]|uniref:Veg family protein n=1 Tax=Limosilactobacillus sp. TaxID=2773925 RepID=UPI0025C1853D|nr:Veg family protein [Limosilactobacillus sp.]MCH3921986.1 Veg family protein [Limosilactobacillus sp.]MCH3928757.1 Veg family protein [Limosilactobacillus sp.]
MPETIDEIREWLQERIGQPVRIDAQAGRKRVNTLHGTLGKTYPAIFIVHLSDDEKAVQRVSYSYTDLLTHNVALTFE